MPELTVPPLDYDYALKRITSFIQEKVAEAGAQGVVVGLSGGVDSTLTTYLAVRALGRNRVHALILPDARVTPKRDVDDAIRVAEELGVEYHVVNIDEIYDAFSSALPFFSTDKVVANGNLRARIRMAILYYYANAFNALVCGTGDRSEILLGYFTKYGDGGVDILPIGDLYKTQVREMARRLGVPENIAEKPSSPRLWAGQLAEEELGASYLEIDNVLYRYVDLAWPSERIAEDTGIPLEKVKAIIRRVHANEHKRMMPPIAKVSRGPTPGLDWRMPWNTKLP